MKLVLATLTLYVLPIPAFYRAYSGLDLIHPMMAFVAAALWPMVEFGNWVRAVLRSLE